MHNIVSIIHVRLDAHKQHQTERWDGRKPISLQQISPSAANMSLSVGFYACSTMCVHMCSHRKLCIILHFLYTTSFCLAMPYQCVPTFSSVSVFVSYYMHICGFLCVKQQCRLPFFPIPLSIAVMPRDDKPFSGASWQGWWGGGRSHPIALEVTGAIATLCAPLRRDIVTGVEWWINLPVSPRDSKINTQTHNNWCVIKAWSMIVE